MAQQDDLRARARAIRLLLLDVDGVLTDGTVYLSATGEELKAFNIQDGLGIKLLHDAGIATSILSGRRSAAVQRRAEELGIWRLQQGVQDKLTAFSALLDELQLPAEQVACVGDDLPDLPLLRRCGLAATVPEAPSYVRAAAHYVTRARGGRGAVREVCELILEAQGSLATLLAGYHR